MLKNAVAPEERTTMEQELADKKKKLQELENRTPPRGRAEKKMHDFDIERLKQEIADLENKLGSL